jgi:hypothetical protein
MLPSGEMGQSFSPCCGKMVCNGCFFQHILQDSSSNCPFCRAALPNDKEYGELLENRAYAHDPKVMYQLGIMYLGGYEKYDKK